MLHTQSLESKKKEKPKETKQPEVKTIPEIKEVVKTPLLNLQLLKQDASVISDIPIGPKKKKKVPFAFLFKPIVSGKDKDYFFENLITLLRSGLDIASVLDSLKLDIKNKGLNEIMNTIEENVRNGLPFWKSIEEVNLVPKQMLNVIRIGEESGKLIENLKIVQDQLERDRDFKGKLRSASLYPIFIVVLMTVVGLGIAVFILPRLATVYESLKTELPFVTKLLIGIGKFLGTYGYFVVPIIIIVLVSLFFFIFVFSRTKFIGQWILLHTPVVKSIITEIEVSRFGFLMGTLLGSGFPIQDAFKLLEQSTDYNAFRNFYKYVAHKIEYGSSIRTAFESYKGVDKVIPPYTRQMIFTAEQTADLPATLERVGVIYLKKNETTTKDLTVLLEPILLIIVFLGVAFIAFAVILPIYSLVGNITDLASPSPTQLSTDAPQNEGTVAPDAIPNDPNAPGVTPAPAAVVQEIEILPNDVGSLNVRDSIGGNVIGQVQPGEVYDYLDFQAGWYQIRLASGDLGWVSGDFVKVTN
ncbi:MAG: type II secretion system F family protein [Candidatus Dojkabacteria bacterium]